MALSICKKCFKGNNFKTMVLVLCRPSSDTFMKVQEDIFNGFHVKHRHTKDVKNGTSVSLAWRSVLKGKNWLLFSHTLVAMDTIRNEVSRVIYISCKTCFTIDLK